MAIENLIFDNKHKSLRIEVSRFIYFMITVEQPITEEKIYEYYYKHIAGSTRWNDALGWDSPEYTDHAGNKIPAKSQEPDIEKLKVYSLVWFDNHLGKAIRKGLSFNKSDYIKRGERLVLKTSLALPPL